MWKFAKTALLYLFIIMLSVRNLPQSIAEPTTTPPIHATSPVTSTPTEETFPVTEPCTLIPIAEISAYLRRFQCF